MLWSAGKIFCWQARKLWVSSNCGNPVLNLDNFSQGAYTSIELLPRGRQSRTTHFSWCARIWCSWKGRVGRTLRRIHWNAQTVCISYYLLSSPNQSSFLQLGWNEFISFLVPKSVSTPSIIKCFLTSPKNLLHHKGHNLIHYKPLSPKLTSFQPTTYVQV